MLPKLTLHCIPIEGSARLPQSIDRPVGGLLPAAEGAALMDEDEALREYGLRSLGGDPEVWDEISGEVLPSEAVRAARAEEVAFMEEWGCWTRVSYEEAVRCGGRKPIATRWVDANQGMRPPLTSDPALWPRTLRRIETVHSVRRHLRLRRCAC